MNMAEVQKGYTVSVDLIRALIEAAKHKGISSRQLLASLHRNSLGEGGPNGQVTPAELCQLCEAILSSSVEGSFALYSGIHLQGEGLSVVTPLVKSAATLRAALDTLLRFSRLVMNPGGICLSEHGNEVVLETFIPDTGSARANQFLAEMSLAAQFRFVRSFDGLGRVTKVSFCHPEPPYRAAYGEIFEGTERFEQSFTGIVFERALLNARSPFHDEDVHDVLHDLASRRLLRITHSTSYTIRVRELLQRQHAPHTFLMEQAARHLGVSGRSLRRRLAEEGKSYRDVLYEACGLVATRLLAEEGSSIQQVSFLMGFSVPSSFHRAFKRWTGMSPSEFISDCQAGVSRVGLRQG